MFTYFFCSLISEHIRVEITYSGSIDHDSNLKVVPALTFCYELGEKTLKVRINEPNETDLIEQVTVVIVEEVVEDITEFIKEQ